MPDEIYKIPVSSPSHHVTYVTIEEDDDDDDWVTFAYGGRLHRPDDRLGLRGVGQRLVLPAVLGYGGCYPYYYRHFPTYGYSACYNPWTGAYGRSAVVYGPYGGAGVGARYNPRTGTYARGAAAWGPVRRARRRAGLQPAHRHLRADASGLERLRQLGIDLGAARRRLGEDQPRTPTADRNDDAAVTAPTKARGHPQGRRTAAGSSRGDGGNVYAGKDGNVYRRAGRHVAEVRQRRLVEHRPAADGDRPTPTDRAGRATGRRRPIAARSIS